METRPPPCSWAAVGWLTIASLCGGHNGVSRGLGGRGSRGGERGREEGEEEGKGRRERKGEGKGREKRGKVEGRDRVEEARGRGGGVRRKRERGEEGEGLGRKRRKREEAGSTDQVLPDMGASSHGCPLTQVRQGHGCVLTRYPLTQVPPDTGVP